MKCNKCGNSEKFFVPVTGYLIYTYDDEGNLDVNKEYSELDSERTIKCANCEAEWDNLDDVGEL